MPRTLVFSHANGFPAGTYRQLFDHWQAAGWRVLAIDKFGHDPRFPVTGNWPRLREQLIHFIEAQAPQGAHLVGHSLGGLLSLMAACRRPDLARGVVMLDSPVITGWRAHSVHMVKLTGLIQRVSPGRVSHQRRHHWPSHQAVAEHWGSKSLFKRWAPGVLDDYIACGVAPAADGTGGVVLAFDRAVETRIYNTLPHNLSGLLARHPLRCPLGFVAGTRSRELRAGGLDMVRRLAGERLRWMEGTHLYPMEKPVDTAQTVLALLEGMADRPPLNRRS